MKFKVSLMGPGRTAQNKYPATFQAAVEHAEAGVLAQPDSGPAHVRITRARLYVHDEIGEHEYKQAHYLSHFAFLAEFTEAGWDVEVGEMSHLFEIWAKQIRSHQAFCNALGSMQIVLVARRVV